MKPELTPQQGKQLEDIQRRIAAHCARDRSVNLASAFAAHERGASSGTIEGRTFCAELARAGLTLAVAEEDLLLSRYAAGGARGQVDYRGFLEDMRRVQAPAGPAQGGVSLTAGQEKLLTEVRKWLASHDAAATLAAQMKTRDHAGKGYLAEDLLAAAVRAAGLPLGGGQAGSLCNCVRPN